MGNYAEDKHMNSHLNHSEEPQLGRIFSSSISRRLNAGETSLIDKFKNIDLNLDRKAVLDDTEPFPGGATHMLPLRPDAGDCPHYMRTGTCMFGETCRFNHPIMFRTEQQAVKDKYSSSGKASKTECKYYSRTGGCKYGIFCKFSHSNHQADTELNSVGLPIRLGEKNCSHYMRYDYCGYGAECVFHHPEPTLIKGLDTLDPSFDDESMIKSGYSRYSNSESPALLSGASCPVHGRWSTHPSSRQASVYQNENLSYVNINSLPQGTENLSEWKLHQAPHAMCEENIADTMLEQNLTSTELEELPERPGQPICTYLLKTGNCKFNSACRFHHPKNWVPKSERCVLSDKGLPLRPGRGVCQNYERFGICKFGSACIHDHPVDLAFVPVGNEPQAQTASGEDSNL